MCRIRLMLFVVGLIAFGLSSNRPVQAEEVAEPAQPEMPAVEAQPEAAASPPASVSLQPNLQAGQSATFELWNRTSVEKTLQVQDRTRTANISQEVNAQVRWSVQSVAPDGSAQCNLELVWVTMDVTNPNGEVMRNDSRQGSGAVADLHQALVVIAGSSVRVMVSADGSVTEVAGMDAINQRLKNLNESADLKSLFDFEEIAVNLATLPAGPAELPLGGRWTHSRTNQQASGTMGFQTTYELAKTELIEGIPVATVTGSSILSLTPDQARLAEAPGLNVRLADSDYQMQIMVDLQRGEVVGRNVVSRMTIETMRDMGQAVLRITDQINSHTQVLRAAETDPEP